MYYSLNPQISSSKAILDIYLERGGEPMMKDQQGRF